MCVFVYHVPLPDGVSEVVLPDPDGHTIYLSDRLGYEARIAAYHHALRHIKNRDFDKCDVQEIEVQAHEIQLREKDVQA